VCGTTTANEEAVTKEQLLLETTVFGGKYREIKVQGSSCRDMQGAADSRLCLDMYVALVEPYLACLPGRRSVSGDVLCDAIASRD
jgi:hypothetical protein